MCGAARRTSSSNSMFATSSALWVFVTSCPPTLSSPLIPPPLLVDRRVACAHASCPCSSAAFRFGAFLAISFRCVACGARRLGLNSCSLRCTPRFESTLPATATSFARIATTGILIELFEKWLCHFSRFHNCFVALERASFPSATTCTKEQQTASAKSFTACGCVRALPFLLQNVRAMPNGGRTLGPTATATSFTSISFNRQTQIGLFTPWLLPSRLFQPSAAVPPSSLTSALEA